jgi:hypothetical protein
MSNRNVDMIRRFDGREVCVYAYVSPGDDVVYVGRTCDLPTRNGAHRARSPWWTPDLTLAVVDVVTGWDAAVKREARAIRDLRPAANIAHNRPSVVRIKPIVAADGLTARERKAASLRALRDARSA